MYGSCEGQAIECVPLDIRLAAPERKFSYLLQECDQFVANRERMRYDEYLAQCYPIASGVIEGACRHAAKDRINRN